MDSEKYRKLLQIKNAKIRELKYEIYRKDPLLWLEEVFGESRISFQWSLADSGKYANHSWDGDKDALANAWIGLANGEVTGLKASTGVGKTYFLSRLVCWFLDCYEDSLVVTTAPSETQLKTNLWGEIQRASAILKKRARPYLKVYAQTLKPEFYNSDLPTKDTHLAIGTVSGAKDGQESATKFQGYHRKAMLIILEEAAGIHPAVVTAALNTLDGSKTNLLIAVGNPDSELDQLHSICALDYVKDYRISSLDHPNVVLGETLFHGAVTQPSIDRRLIQYGAESPLYLSRVRGITPNEGTNTLIRKAWVENAFTDDLNLEVKHFYNAVGVDVANSEQGDKASLCYGKGAVIKEVYEFQCPNASHLAYNLLMDSLELRMKGYEDFGVPTLQEFNITSECVGIDTVGVGVSTLNVFDNLGLPTTSMNGGVYREIIPKDAEGKPLYDFKTGRDQWYWEMREDLRAGNVKINITEAKMRQRILIELTTARFKLSEGKIAIESKNDIKKRLGGKSPNVADAIVYWNWARKGYKLRGGGLPISAGE